MKPARTLLALLLASLFLPAWAMAQTTSLDSGQVQWPAHYFDSVPRQPITSGFLANRILNDTLLLRVTSQGDTLASEVWKQLFFDACAAQLPGHSSLQQYC